MKYFIVFQIISMLTLNLWAQQASFNPNSLKIDTPTVSKVDTLSKNAISVRKSSIIKGKISAKKSISTSTPKTH